MKHIRKNWRRFAAVLLSAALMISTVSQTAFAAGADTGKAIQFVDGGTAANISGGQASSVYFGTYPQNSAGSGGYHTDPNESGDVHTHCVHLPNLQLILNFQPTRPKRFFPYFFLQ